MTTDRPEPAAAAEKHRLVSRWAHRRLGTLAHERRVSEIASTLFRLTAPRHDLTAAHRRLLALAAVVHDVGRVDGEDGHEVVGAKMLLRDESLPLTDAERRAIAFITRYHRGSVPAAGCDSILTEADDHEAVRLTLALLRAADALDSRSLASPRLVFTMRGNRLHIGCYLATDSAKARKVYGRRKKFRLLEELLGCRVEIDVRHAEALSMVA